MKLVPTQETADVLVLNKTDGVNAEEIAYLKSALGAINGFAELLQTTFGKVIIKQT